MNEGNYITTINTLTTWNILEHVVAEIQIYNVLIL